MIRIVAVDDHELVRRGLLSYLSTESDLAVVGEAGTLAEAKEKISELQPDVILLDLILPDGLGSDAIPGLLEVSPNSKIIVLTSYLDDEKVVPAIKAGALSYLLKEVSADDLVAAIRAAARGEAVLHPIASRALTKELTGGGSSGQDALWASLTEREWEVIDLIAAGLSNKEIGDRLFITERTVKSHVSNLLAKLGVQDRTQLAIMRIKKG